MIKLLHISDLHLGKSFTSLGEKGKILRETQLDTFKKIIELGKKEGVVGVLIAGDLFDSNSVGRLLDVVQNLIKESGLKFYILPGAGEKGISGHDALVPGSVYYRESWKDIPNAFIFKNEDGEVFFDSENSIAFYGRPTRYGESPISVLEKHRDAKYHIALAHGSIAFREEFKDYPIKEAEIERSGYDYIALGHWHTFGDYSRGRTKAYYSGSPEILESGSEGKGKALLIKLDGEVDVEPIEVGRFFWASYEVDFSNDIDKAVENINKIFKDPPNTILILRLKGAADFHMLNELKTRLKGILSSFFHVNLDDRSVKPEIDISQYPEGTVISQFIKIMNEKIKTAREEDLIILRESLRIGIGLLTGNLDEKSISLEDYLR